MSLPAAAERSVQPASLSVSFSAAVVLAIVGVVLIRVWLVWSGGQFFFPDEARYLAGREAVALMAQGQWLQGLAHPFEQGDHVGFKFIAIVPAAIELWVGMQPLIPALFVSLFSAANVALVFLIARRIGASRRVQGWSLLAAATSATLFLHSRHLLPYDVSLCWALLALWAGWAPRGTYVRILLAGALAGWAFLTYYGYWTFVGFVGCVICLQTFEWRRSFFRGVAFGTGALLTIGAVIGFNVWAGTGGLVTGARQLSASIVTGDFRGSWVTWEYLWKAERGWLILALIAVGLLGRRLLVGPRDWPEGDRRLLGIAMVGFTFIWGTFIVTGDLLEKFVVHGRLIRQLVPVLCWMMAFGFAALPLPLWRRSCGALLIANGAWSFLPALRLTFPSQFQASWEPTLQTLLAQAGPENYYRFVNVERFHFGVEELPVPAAETVAAARHPFQFEPYLYEGFSASERARRRDSDHRLRLVRIAVPPQQRVDWNETGRVQLDVTFPLGAGGTSEPLLSVGPRFGGDVFFVQYLGEQHVRFGFERAGTGTYFSEPIPVESDQTYRITCYSGKLQPNQVAEGDAGLERYLRGLVWMAVGDEEVLRLNLGQGEFFPGLLYAGANVAAANAPANAFSGTVHSVTRNGVPPLPDGLLADAGYGAVKLVLGPPASRDGRPQPLLAMGEPGRAVIGYVVPLADGRVRLGVESWGFGAWESEPFSPGEERLTVSFSLGSLYPEVGDDAWGDTPPIQQERLKRRITIIADGHQVLDIEQATPDLAGHRLGVGENTVGGSFVGPSYSGEVLLSGREPLPGASPR